MFLELPAIRSQTSTAHIAVLHILSQNQKFGIPHGNATTSIHLGAMCSSVHHRVPATSAVKDKDGMRPPSGNE
jgi:hypothetical protein